MAVDVRASLAGARRCASPFMIADQTPAPFALRAAANAGRRIREAWPLTRARLILGAYRAHYAQARARYAGTTDASASVYDVGVSVVRDGSAGLIPLPADFSDRVRTVADAAAVALDRCDQCEFHPRVAPSTRRLTHEVDEVRNGDVISVKLRDPLRLDGIERVCEPLLEQIERHVYRSAVVVDKVYVYRNVVSRRQPQASWLWHFDNHPREMLKVMIYLTDVDDGSAPFEYLCGDDGRPVRGGPIGPLAREGRVPLAEIEERIAAGARSVAVTGERGTVVLFDDNVIHRATLATRRHRDVIVFQVRPSTIATRPRLDPKWTGSFGHRDFPPNPWRMSPRVRTTTAG
jgi:hypothetical protein